VVLLSLLGPFFEGAHVAFPYVFLWFAMLPLVFFWFHNNLNKKPGTRGPQEKKLALDKNLANGRAGGGQFFLRGPILFSGGPGALGFILIRINTSKKHGKT